MNTEDVREFLCSNHRAVLATHRSDGQPQLSPVTAAIDDDGYVVVSSRETAMKTRNLRRDPRASLCVLSDSFYGDWAQVEGSAQIVALPEAMEGLVDYYRRVSGEHPDWIDYRAAMASERRVLIRIPIERAGPSVAG